MKSIFEKNFEYKLLAYLGIATLSIYLLNTLSSALGYFSDIILMLVFAWILALVVDPTVNWICKKGFSRLQSTAIVYILLGIATTAVFSYLIPTLVNQLSTLSYNLPNSLNSLPTNVKNQIESSLSSILSNSVVYAQTLATFFTGLLIVAFVSFYLVLSRDEISSFIVKIIPSKFEEDYYTIVKILNTTFAAFLRAQLLIGAITGIVTSVILLILKVDFAISAAVLAGVLASIPVVGSLISLVPPILAAATISSQKGIIVGLVLFLIYQLIYNFIGPKILQSALRIHPVFVTLAFLVGYKLAGPWGAILSVPVVVCLGIIGKELIHYWKQGADN